MSSQWWEPLLVVLGGFFLLWCALVAALWVEQRRTGKTVDWREALRLVPDLIRLVRALLDDRSVPPAARWSLIALLGYLLLPFDLIPDVIPVLGIADDMILVALVLRYVIRRAGSATVRRHWAGSVDGLATVLTLAGTRP